jgi:hypothetical protein
MVPALRALTYVLLLMSITNACLADPPQAVPRLVCEDKVSRRLKTGGDTNKPEDFESVTERVCGVPALIEPVSAPDAASLGASMIVSQQVLNTDQEATKAQSPATGAIVEAQIWKYVSPNFSFGAHAAIGGASHGLLLQDIELGTAYRVSDLSDSSISCARIDSQTDLDKCVGSSSITFDANLLHASPFSMTVAQGNVGWLWKRPKRTDLGFKEQAKFFASAPAYHVDTSFDGNERRDNAGYVTGVGAEAWVDYQDIVNAYGQVSASILFDHDAPNGTQQDVGSKVMGQVGAAVTPNPNFQFGVDVAFEFGQYTIVQDANVKPTGEGSEAQDVERKTFGGITAAANVKAAF